MGGSFSTPYGTLNDSQTKAVLDTILREMFKRADLVDLYSMADPDRCKKFVVVAEKALEKLFVKIKLQPRLGKDGIFYFQKLEGIEKANPEAVQQEANCKKLAFFYVRIFQIFAALTITALDSNLPNEDPATLTKPRTGQMVPTFLKPQGISGFIPPQRGGALRSGSTHFLAQAEAGVYFILNNYLSAPDAARGIMDYTFSSIPSMRIPVGELFENGRVKQITDDAATQGVRIVYSYTPDGEKVPTVITARLAIQKEQTTNNYILQLKGIQVNQKTESEGKEVTVSPLYEGSTTEFVNAGNRSRGLDKVIQAMMIAGYEKLVGLVFSPVRFLKQFSFLKDMAATNPQIEGTRAVVRGIPKSLLQSPEIDIMFRTRVRYEEKDQDVDIYTKLGIKKLDKQTALDEQKYEITLNLRDLYTRPAEIRDFMDIDKQSTMRRFQTGVSDAQQPLTVKADKAAEGQTLPQWFDRVLELLLRPLREGAAGVSRAGIRFRAGLPVPVETDKIDEGLKVKRIWEGLARNPPLKPHCVARALQLLDVRSIREGYRDGAYSYSSICRANFPLIKDGSLPKLDGKVTDQYGIYTLTKLYVDVLAGLTPKVGNSEQFRSYATKLKAMFERAPTGYAVDTPNSLEEITDKSMPFCDTHYGEKLMIKNRQLHSALRQKARQLLSIQAAHVRRVMGIIFKLFDEASVKRGILQMNLRLLQGGVEYVNEIALEARQVLLQYYTNCEETYTAGLYLLYNRGAPNELAAGAEFDKSTVNAGVAAAAPAASGNAGAGAAAAAPAAPAEENEL